MLCKILPKLINSSFRECHLEDKIILKNKKYNSYHIHGLTKNHNLLDFIHKCIHSFVL